MIPASAPLLFTVLAIGASGDPSEVRYVAKVVTKSWQPLELGDVEKAVEAKALAKLTAPGSMKLVRSSYADLKSSDYTLTIDGRFIEEAEKFSVYLTFGSGKRNDLPSFHVSDTDSIGHLAKPVMQKKIEALAERAGQRLAQVLSPLLESARLKVVPPPIEDQKLPWEWGPIEVPAVTSPDKAMQDLLEVRNPDHVRHKGLAAIEARVFDQPAARDAVVLCTLRDPSPALRANCARALAPVARAHVPTQRVLLLAMRNEVDDGVLEALAELSKSFVGLSRKECIETWLELVASDATPSQSAERIGRALAEEGDLPNLDLAVAKCLQQESLAYGKKIACADSLFRNIPNPRRRAVAWKYLERLEIHEQGEQNTFDDLKQNLVGGGSEPIDADLAELFLEIAERRTAGRARFQALYIAMRHPSPTPAMIERLITLAHEPVLASAAFRAIVELTDRTASLRPMSAGALRRLRESVHYMSTGHAGDLNEELQETIARLERAH
jgi:hypothetical protein